MNQARIQRAQERQKETELAMQFPDAYCYTTSLGGPGKGRAGTVAECPLDIAARLLVKGEHRLSTPEEVGAFHARQEQIRAANTRGVSAVEDARRRFAGLKGVEG